MTRQYVEVDRVAHAPGYFDRMETEFVSTNSVELFTPTIVYRMIRENEDIRSRTNSLSFVILP